MESLAALRLKTLCACYGIDIKVTKRPRGYPIAELATLDLDKYPGRMAGVILVACGLLIFGRLKE